MRNSAFFQRGYAGRVQAFPQRQPAGKGQVYRRQTAWSVRFLSSGRKDTATGSTHAVRKIDGTVRTWFSDGKPDMVQEYRQGKRNGKEQRFDPKSGKQIYEANYTDDRKEGKQWKISEDITEGWVSKTVSHYKNGELDGPYEYTAHLHGKLYAYKSGSYKNGYKHGSWKEIDRDDIAVQGEYTEGRETGHWIRYDIISGEILNEWDR